MPTAKKQEPTVDEVRDAYEGLIDDALQVLEDNQSQSISTASIYWQVRKALGRGDGERS